MAKIKERYDGLVLGGGIAGMQAALDLAGQGYDVLLVEKEPSIGGVMVGLNKVFPTLDCSSCICTPRMAETAHHERITVQAYTEVEEIRREGDGFRAKLIKKPRYVVEEDCIGCSKCELACPTLAPHEFDYGLGARGGIYIPHGNAIPQVAVLDPTYCIFDGACARACPTDCIDFTQLPEEVNVEVGAVILATGLKVTPMNAKKEYGGGKHLNVMNPLAMERVQSSNGPYGHVLRPSDGKIAKSVAYVQCAGSRDKSIGVPYCSRVCCMYALKQGIMIKHHRHETEVTIYHMDIRAFGKGYEQFYRRAMAEGIHVVKAKVARITEEANQDLTLRVELIDEGGRVADMRHDLVVLSLGTIPGWRPNGRVPAETDDDGFFRIREVTTRPANSSRDGIFVAGVATGPKDIPDAIVEAGAAAMEAAMYLDRTWSRRAALVGAGVEARRTAMSETKRNWREDVKVFRERMGGLTEEKKAMAKDQRDTTKAIQGALKGGPRTVPEISAETKIPSHKVLWYVMAMKRFGKVAEAGQAGDYFRYELKEASS